VTRLEEETRIGKGGTLAGQLSRLDLVVLDELGYLPFARSLIAALRSSLRMTASWNDLVRIVTANFKPLASLET